MMTNLIDEIKNTNSKNIADYLIPFMQNKELQKQIWKFSENNIEQGLDAWMLNLAKQDRPSATKAAAIAANYAYQFIMNNHAEKAEEYGFSFMEGSPSLDGESGGTQIKRVIDWIKSPTPNSLKDIANSIDPARQLNVWEEDLYPSKDDMWIWFQEVGQLLAMSVVASDNLSPKIDESPYKWPDIICLSRSVICSLKTLAAPMRNVTNDAAILLNCIGKEFDKF